MRRLWIASCLFACLTGLPASGLAYTKIIIIDKSGSMGNPDRGGGAQTKYNEAKQLILQEVTLDLESRDTRVTLIFFDSFVSGIVEVRSIAEARSALDSFKPSGETNIGDTLAYALKLIKSTPSERYIMVSLYTDGQEALSNPARQRVSKEMARRSFISYFNSLKTRTFVSFYHHMWNSKENRDFSRILRNIQQQTRGNKQLQLVLEENKDPSKRARFAGLILRLDQEKIYLERPRGQDIAPITIGLQFQATRMAYKHKLVFELSAHLRGLKTKVDPTRLIVDKASGKLQLRVWLKGLGQLREYRPYELELRLKLSETENDNLVLQQIKDHRLILRLMPGRLYTHFVLAPSAIFSRVSPRDGKLSDALKVGRRRYHPVELAWNKTAVGSKLNWTLSAALRGAVKLVDSRTRRPLPRQLTLDGRLKRKMYLAVSLEGKGDLSGSLTFKGAGKLAAVPPQTVQIKLTEQVGRMSVQFPDRRTRKLFAGLPLLAPLAIQLKPDRLAVGERFLVKTRVPSGVSLEIRDNFERVLNNQPISVEVESGSLFHLGLRMTLARGLRLEAIDLQAIRIILLPVDGTRLRIIGRDGKSPTEGFPLPFELVAPKRELTARLDAPGRLFLRPGDSRKLDLLLGWTADADKQRFSVKISPRLVGPAGGACRTGIRWRWADGNTGIRTFKLGGAAGALTHRLALELIGGKEGESRLLLDVVALGQTQKISLPIRGVVGEARVRFKALGAAIEPASWQTLGQLRFSLRNRFAAGQPVQVIASTEPGVQLRFFDASGRALATGKSAPPWQLPTEQSPASEIRVEVQFSYAALKAGLGQASLQIRSGPQLRLFRQDREQSDYRLSICWNSLRPRLAYLADGKPVKDVKLGLKKRDEQTLVSAAGVKLAYQLTRTPVAIEQAVRAETVTVAFEEWKERAAIVESIVFSATGKPTATIDQLLEEPGLTVRFKKTVPHPWFAEQPMYARLTFSSSGPVELSAPQMRIKVVLPPRFKPPLLIGVLLIGAFVLFVGIKLSGARRGSTEARSSPAEPIEAVDLSQPEVAQVDDGPAISLEDPSLEVAPALDPTPAPTPAPAAGAAQSGTQEDEEGIVL